MIVSTKLTPSKGMRCQLNNHSLYGKARLLTSRTSEIALISLLCTSIGFAERHIRITGDMHLVSVDFKKTVGKTNVAEQTNRWTINFVATIGSDKQWGLEGDFCQGAITKYFFDGTNVCNSLQITKPPPANMVTSKFGFMFPPLATVNSNLTINIKERPSGCPLSDTGVNIAWLAFCSGTFLKQNTRTIPLPTTTGPSQDLFAYSDKTATFEDGLGLPRTVELFTSKALYEAWVNEFSKILMREMKVPNITDGLMKFHYSVTASTNLLGWNVPVAFEFGDDIPEDNGTFLRNRSGTGQVTAIDDSSAPVGVFDTTLNQVVIDWRFRSDKKDLNAIVYKTTNAFVSPTNSAVLQAHLSKQLDRAPLHASIRNKRLKLVLFGLFFLVAGFPVAGFLWRKQPELSHDPNH